MIVTNIYMGCFTIRVDKISKFREMGDERDVS